MENNIKCPNCGADNRIDAKFCENCGNSLTQNAIANGQDNVKTIIPETSTVNSQTQSNDSVGNKLAIISLVLYFCNYLLYPFVFIIFPSEISMLLKPITGLFPLAGIVVMIAGRIKYPTNKALKIAMWIIIVTIVLSLLAFILLVIYCYVTCKNMDTSGCG